MRRFILEIPLIVAAIVAGVQAQEPKAADAALPNLPLTTSLPRSYPVITVQSDCPKAASKAAGKAETRCKTVITRAEFEELVNAINPRMIKQERQQLAQNYGRMLALSNEALNRGIDKRPEMQALLRYVKASALGGALYKQVLRSANAHSDEDVEQYYRAHVSEFDRYNFQRLFIPATRQGQPATPDALAVETDDTSTAAEMKSLAEKIHVRAVAGEDFVALQKEAFQQGGIQSEPNVEVSDLSRGSLPAEDNQVFDLKPGAVSPTISGPTGYTIYKLISKQTPPFESVKDQVSIEMENHSSQDALRKIENIKINDRYFEKYDAPAANTDEPEVDDD